jgi:predicted nucleic acid-binding protein
VIVVDASAAVDLLLRRSAANQIADLMRENEDDVHAPELIYVEAVSALRRRVVAGDSSSRRAAEAIDDLLSLPLEIHPHRPLVRRAWGLRDNLSAYDAAYVALAQSLGDGGVPLLTTDASLARAAHERGRVAAILAGAPPAS